MITSPSQLAAHTDVVAGLSTAGGALGIATDGLLQRYQLFALATRGPVRIATDDRFESLSVRARKTGARSAQAERRKAFLEYRVTAADSEPVSIDHAVGSPLPRGDLDKLVACGVEAEVIRVLSHRLAVLDPKSASAGWTVEHGDEPVYRLHVRMWNGERETLPGLLAVAEEVGSTEPQRTLLAAVHRVLGREPACLASLACRGAEVLPSLAITYPRVPMAHVLRLLTGIHPGGDHATQLGHFSGAVGGEDYVSELTLELGPRDPLGVRIALDMEVE